MINRYSEYTHKPLILNGCFGEPEPQRLPEYEPERRPPPSRWADEENPGIKAPSELLGLFEQDHPETYDPDLYDHGLVNLYEVVERQIKRIAAQEGEFDAERAHLFCHLFCGLVGMISEFFDDHLPKLGPDSIATNMREQGSLILVKPEALHDTYLTAIYELGENHLGLLRIASRADFAAGMKADILSCESHNIYQEHCDPGAYPTDPAAVQNGIMMTLSMTNRNVPFHSRRPGPGGFDAAA